MEIMKSLEELKQIVQKKYREIANQEMLLAVEELARVRKFII